MTVKDHIYQRMTGFEPEAVEVVDRHIRYADARQCHRSYRASLLAAKEGTPYHRAMLGRCYDWLRLLKEKNIALLEL
jgi:hypothetical protein